MSMPCWGIVDFKNKCLQARGQGKSSNAAGKAAKMLVDEALRNNTADNVTALVIWIDWD